MLTSFDGSTHRGQTLGHLVYVSDLQMKKGGEFREDLARYSLTVIHAEQFDKRVAL